LYAFLITKQGDFKIGNVSGGLVAELLLYVPCNG